MTVDLSELAEGKDLEAKLAAGRDRQGELPASFFETYSAFANTDGGVVLLGVRERGGGKLEPVGVPDVERVQKQLWDGLNNRQQVNINLLANSDVSVVEAAERRILRVVVPRAARRQQPVWVGTNPLTGTFRRGNAGDYRVPEENVRRMLAEQVEDSRDGPILERHGFDDLDASTLARYRQRYQTRSPDHPWNSLDSTEFLRCIGGWARDRERGIEGVTAAGLLMFGKLVVIRELFPNYMLDYQERSNSDAQLRWSDRVTTDGSWSGNLYDFYQTVIQRLFRDLRGPFRLAGDTRLDDTPVHEALREALVNTLIHADYTGRTSVLVIKRPDLFGFRNPGRMRMPIEMALHGGVSDCRNRRLQDMFRYVGLGEQAGSGVPRIRAAWRQQEWRAPEILEQVEPYEQTTFALRMASLLPSETVAMLEQRFGKAFQRASEVQKLALVTAALEGSVTHARLNSMTDAHSRDVTIALASLVQRNLLSTGGAHKRTFYFLSGDHPPTTEEFAFPRDQETGASAGRVGSVQTGPSSVQTGLSSVQTGHETARVEAISSAIRSKKRVSRTELRSAILALCTDGFVSLPELARLTGRSAETLRTHHIGELVAAGKMTMQYPEQPTHPAQAYRTLETQRR